MPTMNADDDVVATAGAVVHASIVRLRRQPRLPSGGSSSGRRRPRPSTPASAGRCRLRPGAVEAGEACSAVRGAIE